MWVGVCGPETIADSPWSAEVVSHGFSVKSGLGLVTGDAGDADNKETPEIDGTEEEGPLDNGARGVCTPSSL